MSCDIDDIKCNYTANTRLLTMENIPRAAARPPLKPRQEAKPLLA